MRAWMHIDPGDVIQCVCLGVARMKVCFNYTVPGCGYCLQEGQLDVSRLCNLFTLQLACEKEGKRSIVNDSEPTVFLHNHSRLQTSLVKENESTARVNSMGTVSGEITLASAR